MNVNDIIYFSGTIITFLVLSYCCVKYKSKILEDMGITTLEMQGCVLLSIICLVVSLMWFISIPLAVLALIIYFKKDKGID